MNDNELFELCKAVYEKTGWKDTDFGFCEHELDGNIILPYYRETENYEKWFESPLYTSDYLLEKLPANIESKVYPENYAQLWLRKQEDEEEPVKFFAYYAVMTKPDCVSDYGVHSNTGLKALLKLVIALDDAGELK